MNQTVIFVASFLMRAVCFGGAVFLAYHNRDGWGWLIFAGCITGISTGDSDEKNN